MEISITEQTNLHAALPKEADFNNFSRELGVVDSDNSQRVTLRNHELHEILDLACLQSGVRAILEEAKQTPADYYYFYPTGSQLPL
jgi:hypothetical protein